MSIVKVNSNNLNKIFEEFLQGLKKIIIKVNLFYIL